VLHIVDLKKAVAANIKHWNCKNLPDCKGFMEGLGLCGPPFQMSFVEIESALKNDGDARKKTECGIPRIGHIMPNHRLLKTPSNGILACGIWKAEG